MREHIGNSIIVFYLHEVGLMTNSIIKAAEIQEISRTSSAILNAGNFACSLMMQDLPEVKRVFSLLSRRCMTTFSTSTRTIALMSWLFPSTRFYFYILSIYNYNHSNHNQMLALKAFFGFSSQISPQQLLEQYFALISVNTMQPLPPLYYQFPLNNEKQSQRPVMLRKLVHALRFASSIPAIFKILTVVCKILRLGGYEMELVQILSEIQIPEMLKTQKEDNQWAYQFVIAIKSYFLRLPSIADILQVSIQPSFQMPSNSETCLSNLFKLINVFGLLFPNFNNGINTVGRYYMKTHLFMLEFYKVLKEEVLLGYAYIEKIVKKFITNYKDCDLKSLEYFMTITPEIELFCDKAQEFIMNKYFKGKSPGNKIYFKEDYIQEIAYFLNEKKTGEDVTEERKAGTE